MDKLKLCPKCDCNSLSRVCLRYHYMGSKFSFPIQADNDYECVLCGFSMGYSRNIKTGRTNIFYHLGTEKYINKFVDIFRNRRAEKEGE